MAAGDRRVYDQTVRESGPLECRRQGGAMDDKEVLGRIDELAREEHQLFERESHGKVTDADRARLRQIEVTLDQCWDLLRQRRAAGRPASIQTTGRCATRTPSRGTRRDP